MARQGVGPEGDREPRPLVNTKKLGAAFASSLAAAGAAAGVAAPPAAASISYPEYCYRWVTVNSYCPFNWEADNVGNKGHGPSWFRLYASDIHGNWDLVQKFNQWYWMGSNWGPYTRWGEIINANQYNTEFLKGQAPYVIYH